MKLTEIGGNANDGLYRHPDSGIIYFRKYREGKGEIFRSTRTKDLALARRARDKMMAELWGDKPKVVKRKTCGELWPVWYEGKKATKSEGTASSIKYAFQNLAPYIDQKFPEELTETWWLTEYVPQKREELDSRGNPKTDRKFENEKKWSMDFLGSCKRQGLISEVPKFVNPDPPREKGEVLKPGQYEALLDSADWSLMAKLVMGRDHFMRRTEVAFLEKAWINREARSITLPAWVTKIRRGRTFPYNETLEWLFQILEDQDRRQGIDSRFVFPSPSDPAASIGRSGFKTAWSGCKRRAGVKAGFRFHWLRHTGLTLAFKTPGANVAKICAAAGLDIHEAMETYVHFTIDDLRGVENLAGET